MGCLCSLCFYPIGHVVYVIEKIASCCAIAAIISCLVATLVIMLGVGVGLGYNYCYVDFKVREVTTTSTTLPTTTTIDSLRSRDNVFVHQEQLESPDNVKGSDPVPEAITVPVMPTIVLPFKDADNLMLLISKLQESKRNITLELIT